MDNGQLSVCISTIAFKSKEEAKANYGKLKFERLGLTVEEFASKIKSGHSFCNVSGSRKGVSKDAMRKNFQSYYLALDIDGVKSENRYPTNGDRVDIRKLFGDIGILPTLEYLTLGAKPDEGINKFRMMWILNTPITDADQYEELSKKINEVAGMNKSGIPADKATSDISRLWNGTTPDKGVDFNKRYNLSDPSAPAEYRTYGIEDMMEALKDVKFEEKVNGKKQSKPKSKRKGAVEENDLCGAELEELEEIGLVKFVEKHANLPIVTNNYGMDLKSETEEFTALPEDYQEFTTPKAYVNGTVRRRKLVDGMKRRMWIYGWSSCLSHWFKKRPGILDKENWRSHFIVTIGRLILDNIELDGISDADIVEKLTSGYMRPAECKDRQRLVIWNKAVVMANNGYTTQDEYINHVRRRNRSVTSAIKAGRAKVTFDPKMTLTEQAKEHNMSVNTYKKNLKEMGINYEEERLQQELRDRELLIGFVKENYKYGVGGVFKLLKARNLDFCPKSRHAIYSIFDELELPRGGVGKENEIMNKVCEDQEDLIERYDEFQHRYKGDAKVNKSTEALIKTQIRKANNNRRELEAIKEELIESRSNAERKYQDILNHLSKSGSKSNEDDGKCTASIVHTY